MAFSQALATSCPTPLMGPTLFDEVGTVMLGSWEGFESSPTKYRIVPVTISKQCGLAPLGTRLKSLAGHTSRISERGISWKDKIHELLVKSYFTSIYSHMQTH